MGVWGTGLYDDDLSSDIRGSFIEQLENGKSSVKITRELIEEYKTALDDPSEEAVFWFALADTQWDKGVLAVAIKDQALRSIHAGAELEKWKESPDDLKKREKVLKDLEKKLNSPQPVGEKKKSKRVKPKKIGDIFSIKTSRGYKFVQYIGDSRNGMPVIRILDGIYDKENAVDEKLIKVKEDYFLSFLIYHAHKMSEIVSYVGNYPVPDNISIPLIYRCSSKRLGEEKITWFKVEDVDHIRHTEVSELTPEFLQLSPWDIWSFPDFVEKIEQGWNLKDWK